jgi:tetratricopeptide (TPR) repeat protein
MKRAQALALVKAKGGMTQRSVTKETVALVVGALGWPLLPDGCLSKTLLKARSYSIPVVSERIFLSWTGKVPLDGQAKTYTKEQLAALCKTAPEVIDEFAMFGLLEPEAGLFGFRDLAAARQIAGLIASGVKLSTIMHSLAAIRTWLPEAGLANLRLYSETPANLLIETGGGRTDSRGQFVLPIEPLSEDADAAFEEALAAEQDEDWEKAERLYRLVMKLDPEEAAAPFNLANIFCAQNKPIEAELLYREAVVRDPGFAEAWYNLGGLLEEQRRIEEAVRCLHHAIKASPEYADAVFNLALLLQRQEMLSEAAAQWKRYLDIDRTSDWVARARRGLKYCEIQLSAPLAAEVGS